VIKRGLFWLLALLLGTFGALCVLFPLAMLAPVDPGAHLLDDTRAAFGGGRPVEVTVGRVLCNRQEFGSEGSQGRGIHSFEYDCTFELDVPAHEAPAIEPDWASMTYEEQAEFQRVEQEKYSARLRELERGPGPHAPPRELRGRLPRSAAGRPAPVLRQLTGDGVPPRYGLVWADGGLGGRWLRWAWETLIFWSFAAACFVAIPALRRILR
jgi:hypothetical protein